VRDATDRVVEADGNGTDIVKAAVSYTLSSDASIETLRTIDDSATTAIDLTGNSHTTLIVGNAGANHLTGGSGDETLTGGGGADVFVFAASGVGHDTVGDFVSGTDKLDLSAYFADFATFQAATHDVGGNAVIDLGGGQNVTLSGVLSAQIQSGDVITASGQTPLHIIKADVQHALVDVDVLTPNIMIHDTWNHGPAMLALL
jgi:Ca2+-binding RTX toxin-like protein